MISLILIITSTTIIQIIIKIDFYWFLYPLLKYNGKVIRLFGMKT